MKRHILIQLISAFLILFAFSCQKDSNDSVHLMATADKMKADERYLEALQYYSRGYMAAEKEHNDFAAMRCAGNVSILYHCFGNIDGCFQYGELCYKLAMKTKNVEVQSSILSNLVTYCAESNDTAKARKYYAELTKLKPGNITKHLYYCLYEKARIFKAENEADSAILYHRKALDYAKREKMQPIYRLFQNSEIGNILVMRGRCNEAIAMGRRCLAEAERLGSNDMKINSLKMLADSYAKTGEQDSAYVYSDKYNKLYAKMYNMPKFFSVQNDLYSYESSVKEKHISKLTAVLSAISLLFVALILLTLVIVYKNKVLRQTQKILIAKNKELMEMERKQLSPESVAEEKSSSQQKDSYVISDEKREILLKRIRKAFADLAVISDPDFNLIKLAEMVGSNTKYVSVVINEECHKSFKSMLTECRIKEACRRLDDDRYGRYTIRTIYEEVGYRNAASFNRCFKSVMGMTPTVYQQLSSEQEER